MTLLADFETQHPYIDDYAIGYEQEINDSKDLPFADAPRYGRCFQLDFLRLHDNIYRIIQSEEHLLEESLANSMYDCYLQFAPAEMTVQHNRPTLVDLLDFKITGQAVRGSDFDAAVELVGTDRIGSKITDSEPMNCHETNSHMLREAPAYTITGKISQVTPSEFEVDWLGGDTIHISRSRAYGKWNELQVGDWFKGVIVRREGGEILNATLLSTIPTPKKMADSEIESFYSNLKPVVLTPSD